MDHDDSAEARRIDLFRLGMANRAAQIVLVVCGVVAGAVIWVGFSNGTAARGLAVAGVLLALGCGVTVQAGRVVQVSGALHDSTAELGRSVDRVSEAVAARLDVDGS